MCNFLIFYAQYGGVYAAAQKHLATPLTTKHGWLFKHGFGLQDDLTSQTGPVNPLTQAHEPPYGSVVDGVHVPPFWHPVEQNGTRVVQNGPE